MKVIVADDHSLFRLGITSLLEAAGHEVVAQAGSVDELLGSVTSELACDVVLQDYRMPGGAALDVYHSLQKMGASAKVLFLTSIESAALYQKLLAENIGGILIKKGDTDSILEALETCHAGKQYLDVTVKEKLTSVHNKLTKKENLVLQEVAAGRSSQQIADNMGNSLKTVEFHRANIMRKLAVESLVELVKVAHDRTLYAR